MSLGGMLVHARLQSLPLPLPITGLSSRRMRALVLSNLSLPLLRALAKDFFYVIALRIGGIPRQHLWPYVPHGKKRIK